MAYTALLPFLMGGHHSHFLTEMMRDDDAHHSIRLLKADKLTTLPSFEIEGMGGPVFEAKEGEVFCIEVRISGKFLREEIQKP